MSFNSQRDGILPPRIEPFTNEEVRFNSQRDGILLDLLASTHTRIWSFNSQRDGILRFHLPISLNVSSVSIPNGMEFYEDVALFRHQLIVVSIPNGMEFYSSVTVSKWISECFNSQRDGILLLLPSQFVLNALAFQFPTGWNSTVGNTGIAVTRKLFQFPTGWNSTKPDGFVDKLTAVSIPNGMEFYNL